MGRQFLLQPTAEQATGLAKPSNDRLPERSLHSQADGHGICTARKPCAPPVAQDCDGVAAVAGDARQPRLDARRGGAAGRGGAAHGGAAGPLRAAHQELPALS